MRQRLMLPGETAETMYGADLAVFWVAPKAPEPACGGKYAVTLHHPDGSLPHITDALIVDLEKLLGDEWSVGNHATRIEVGSAGYRADEVVLPALAGYFCERRQLSQARPSS